MPAISNHISKYSMLLLSFAFIQVNGVIEATDKSNDLASVVGTEQANCKQCHPSEVEHWQKTTHFLSVNRLEYKENSKKYADALGIESSTLKTTSMCADCHGTKTIVDGTPKLVSGVSCESCHGGAKDWLKPHAEYFAGQKFKDLKTMHVEREKETPEHRLARNAATRKAGMIRPDMLHELAQNCMSCHIIDNEKLILAGHKPASSFELTSWLNGEVRHNFFMDPKTNADGPSLWMKTHNATPEQRNRTKFVVGELTHLQTALQRRATATNAIYIPQIGGTVAAANGKLAQINAVAGTPQTQAATAVVGPLFGTLFAPLPTDEKTYLDAAEKIAEQTRAFIREHDGSQLQGLDALINSLPAHFSQQFRDR